MEKAGGKVFTEVLKNVQINFEVERNARFLLRLFPESPFLLKLSLSYIGPESLKSKIIYTALSCF